MEITFLNHTELKLFFRKFDGMLRCFSLVSGQSVMIIPHSRAPCKDTLAAWLPKASLKRSCLENERFRKKMSVCL